MDIKDFTSKKAKVSVVGLGYVGLPLALAFARKLSVVGFDIDPQRIAMLKKGEDPSQELSREAFADTDILYTDKVAELAQA
ncbi:MAG: nucleotide sugar dehydrogenase, partial [Bacteroidales bacterium]|nr:nucleotide sugar dehydrogenase [Bacteroidales bacterium]